MNITPVLGVIADGKMAALEQLIPLVHKKLHEIAEGLLSRENPGHDLQPTVLINELFIKLLNKENINYIDSEHFFSAAAQIMRFIIIDFAKARNRAMRGGGAKHLQIDEEFDVSAKQDKELIALNDALEALSKIDPTAARVIELRYFLGLSIDETAVMLGVSPSTVDRSWRWARAWLYKELRKEKTDVL